MTRNFLVAARPTPAYAPVITTTSGRDYNYRQRNRETNRKVFRRSRSGQARWPVRAITDHTRRLAVDYS